MPEVNLETTYMLHGQTYGPGFVTVPDELAIALNLPSTQPKANESETSDEANEAQGETQETEGKLRINEASAEAIADRLSGVGLNTAKKVVQLRDSLPDQKLNMSALKSIPRADWDALASEIDFT